MMYVLPSGRDMLFLFSDDKLINTSDDKDDKE
jgi:hypothetical protein